MAKRKQSRAVSLEGDATQALRELTIQRKLLEDELKAASDRNRRSLEELRHRVRNSFNVILGLLHLQLDMRVGGSQEVAAALGALERCVQGVVLLHDSLLHHDDSGMVGMRDYLGDIAAMVAARFARLDVHVRAEIEPVETRTTTAMACGLMVNELLSNGYAHAFTAGRGGIIDLKLGSFEGSRRLTVSDDGVGLPPGFLVDACGTMGMRLVSLYAGKLRARVAAGRSEAGGAFFSLTFPQTIE